MPQRRKRWPRRKAAWKCYAVDKKKDYASLKEISKKYAGKPDAEAKILNQITAGVKVKLDDGSEEEHKIVKSKDQAAINNMIQWILSLK